jgi:hypothetical protein
MCYRIFVFEKFTEEFEEFFRPERSFLMKNRDKKIFLYSAIKFIMLY